MSILNKLYYKFSVFDTYSKRSTDDEIVALKRFCNIEIPEDYIKIIEQMTDVEISVDSDDNNKDTSKKYIRIWGAKYAIDMNPAYKIQHYIPNSLVIGDNGGGYAIIYVDAYNGFGLYYVGFGDLDINSVVYISRSLSNLLVYGEGIQELIL